MPQTVYTLILVVCSTLAAVGLVTYAVAKYRVDRSEVAKKAKDEYIDTLEGDAARDTREIDRLNKEVALRDATIKVKDERIASLESERATLARSVAAKADWQALKDLVDHRHKEVVAELAAIREAIKR